MIDLLETAMGDQTQIATKAKSLLPYARIVGIIWLARTDVKVERSEFILNLTAAAASLIDSVRA